MKSRLTAAVLIGIAMTGTSEAKGPLTGGWGGDRTRLTLTAQGGKIEQDCGYGTISGPVKPDRSGRFVAKGSFDAGHAGSGPQDADKRPAPATFTGHLVGDTLHLTIKGAGAPQTLALKSGQGAKLIRCM